MDPPLRGFDELEQALGRATFTFGESQRVSSTSAQDTSHTGPSLPTASFGQPDPSRSPPVSPLSNLDYNPIDVSITPPPEHQPELRRHSSGLPPTPPTLTNSDVAGAKDCRSMSPIPLFADRVRNALESQKSGFTTPIAENQSPPTPDPSPRAILPTLAVPRPLLSHQGSAQSHAESFLTATEGLSSSSRAEFHVNPDEEEQEDQKFLDPLKAARASRLESRNGADALGLSDQSDRGEARVKTYHVESDTDREGLHTMKIKTESGGDMGKSKAVIMDESPTSPSLRKALDHRAATQRLWKPIQPGDAVKRPDPALLYSSNGTNGLSNGRNTSQLQARREVDTDLLGKTEELAPVKTSEVPQASSPELEAVNHDDSAKKLGNSFELTANRESDRAHPKAAVEAPAPNLREFAPLQAPPDPTPPTTAQKESLDENNLVYRIIQEENAKRHSAISHGSVPAVVVPGPDHKRKLRHTPKRESLRGDPSIEGNSKRSSSESGPKLKHKKATIQNVAVGSMLAYQNKTPQGDSHDGTRRGEGGPMAPVAMSQYQEKQSANGRDVLGGQDEDTNFSARISRFAPGEHGFDHWSSIPYPTDHDQSPVLNRSTSPTPGNEPKFTPRKLRRSLRERGLDRYSSVTDGSDARPASERSSAIANSETSPKLRRSSQDKRLDKNYDVGRTSLHVGREVQTPSQALDAKLDLAAEDLTREGREMRDRASIRERHNSSDRSFHTAASPRRKSFDPRYLHPVGTPYSASQFSDRTEVELLEARGIELFPHNNDSLLIVQQTARGVTKPTEDNQGAPADPKFGAAVSRGPPVFQAYIEKPQEPEHEIGRSKHTVDSPLTNPRAAPEPPVIKFIPPTPNQELEQMLDAPASVANDPRKGMQRRLSLSQRVRRYSENLIQPLPFGRTGSFRKQEPKRITTMPEPRPTYLSSFWQPRDFWEEYDSDDDSEDYGPLPPGGDTSNAANERRTFFPRNMSVRMPGFRGNGGFLVGNSLGLDRHGTNNRRHYVAKRTSIEMIRKMAESKRRRTFTMPFSRGTKIEYIGFAGLSARMRELKQRRQAKALEQRRDRLRGQIGTRLYHDVK